MSRTEQLTKLIKQLSTTTPDVEAAAIVDNDGLIIASSLPQGIEEEGVAAMTAALLGISERIASELSRGEFEMVMIKGGQGYAVITRSGPESVLAVLTTQNAKLGLIFMDVKRTCKEIARILN